MTDKHVDELLADLDRALAVEPSPSVAASVRTRIAQQPAAGWLRLGWRPVLMASVTAVGMIVVAYLAWPGTTAPAVKQTVASSAAELPVATTTGSTAATTASVPMAGRPAGPGARTARSAQATPVRTMTAVEHEPEVLVSSGVRIALAQLAAAVRDGRLSADSIPPDGPIVLPDPIVVPAFVIEPFKLDLARGSGAGNEIR